MVSRDANSNALQQHRQEENAEGQRERSGSESSSDAPPASSSYSIMNNTFRVDSRYSALKAIGKGSFGFVCSAQDEKQVRRPPRGNVGTLHHCRLAHSRPRTPLDRRYLIIPPGCDVRFNQGESGCHDGHPAHYCCCCCTYLSACLMFLRLSGQTQVLVMEVLL